MDQLIGAEGIGGVGGGWTVDEYIGVKGVGGSRAVIWILVIKGRSCGFGRGG